MQSVMIRHTVKDFATWKATYDQHAAARTAAGLSTTGLWANQQNPNEVVIVFGVSDMAQAQEFMGSDNLKQTMAAAGVIGRPDVTILNEA